MKLNVNGYEYYQIALYVNSEVAYDLGDDLSIHIKKIFYQVLKKDISKVKINCLDFERYKIKPKVRKVIYVEKEIDEKWSKIPKKDRKVLQYLINKKLKNLLKNIYKRQNNL